MDNTQYNAVSDAEINRAIARAHEMRSEVLHSGIRAIGLWFKSQFHKIGYVLSRREAA